MEWIVLGFLGLSLYLYCLLGGADFGAGVLELFLPKTNREKYRDLIIKAMGPVWEANHIWLIILIVILFNGFPKAYAQISIYFHIPLTLMLIGIIFRGCAFTFRTYDAVKDNSREVYSLAFSLSSVITPIMFGMIIGGLMLGKVDPQANTYYAKFIAPWLNVFCFSVGLFVLSIFTFSAGVFLMGESKDPEIITHFTKQVQKINILMVIIGAAVFAAAYRDGLNLIPAFLNHPISLAGVIGATIPLFFFWRCLKNGGLWFIRSIIGFQLAMILLAWFTFIYPNFLFLKNGIHLAIFAAIAPAATIRILGGALIIGSALFLPALYYLFLVFKIKESVEEDH